MASSSAATTGSALPLHTIVLHILSPSAEVNGGRITFPRMPLDTKISHLKARIQNSVTGPAPPERQRLIYRGRPLLNVETTLREILRSELDASTDQNPTFTFHLVIIPTAGSMAANPTPTSQTHVPQHMSTPPAGSQGQRASTPHHHHHNHQPHAHLPAQAAMAQAQAAQAMLQNQLSQLQYQIAMTSMMGQTQGQGQGQRHVPNQPPHVPLFPVNPSNMQAFQATIMQQQQMRAHAGMHGVHNPTMNGVTSGMPFGQNPPRQIGPITTRVHETVNPDGNRTRVIVNEATFQISRQSTPVPAPSHAEDQSDEHQSQGSTNSSPQLPPIRPQPRLQHVPPLFPSRSEQQGLPSHLHDFVPRQPAYRPTFPNPRQETTSTTTTAWLLSSPTGPQALVFAPDHGLFTTTLPTTQPSTRISRPPNDLRFQQSPSGRIRPQNIPNVPALPALNPEIATAHQQAREAIDRARTAAAAARQAAAAAGPPNNELLRTVLSRIWTFIKLYFVIFMFTESGTWFRWICLFAAALVSVMPTTTVFRGFAARLQAHIDGLIPPPRPAAAAAPPRQPQIEGRRQDAGGAPNAGAGAGGRAQAEPDPAATAARLIQEHRERHPNALRDGFEWAERAVGLFVASLIPGVGERHVRAREEARREVERLERERERLAAEQDEERRRVEGEEGKQKSGDGGEELGQASERPDKKEQVNGPGSAATKAEGTSNGGVTAEEPLRDA